MAKKNVTFIATQYRNKPVHINFYTKDGERVNFTATEKATFIATQYRNKPVHINFYTKDGERVNFTATEKAPVRTRVHFRARDRKS